MADHFDYIVVGGGTAGSIMTNRLSADGASVCLLEACPEDYYPLIHIPAGYIKNIYSRRLTAGLGVAILPLGAVEPFADSGGLALIPLDEPWANRTLKLATCERISRAAQALLESLVGDAKHPER